MHLFLFGGQNQICTLNLGKQYITKSFTEKKIVPNFLIDKELKVENLDALLDGLNLISNFLDKTIFKPNNINHPVSRLQFIASLK